MKRVGIIGLLHESNTFIAQPTTIEHFRSNILASGSAAVDAFRGSQHEMGGFIEALASDSDIETVGVFAARATPYGTIAGACWTQLMTELENELRSCLPLDGLLVAPHGATVAEYARDADGDWLGRVRSIVGPNVPILGTLDLHANVSQAMVDATNALFGYRTNPHLDQHARGVEAGRVMLRALRNEIRPCQSLVQLPLCVNIERQATAESQGRKIWERADELATLYPGVLSVSCLYGFPYADVEEMGASVMVVGDSSAAPIQAVAREMADTWWEHRDEFRGQLISIEDAIAMALQARQAETRRSVGLLEMGDNVGGGSPGDGTWIVHGWLRSGCGDILTVIADSAAVRAAVTAGVGAKITLSVGGKESPDLHGPPLEDRYLVKSLSDGKFYESGITHGGYNHFDQGETAVLVSDRGVTIVATTLRVAPLSLAQVRSQGLDPNEYAAIVIKGVHAPAAAYANVCSRLIRVNTRGVTTADLNQLDFQHRRRPMFPFET